MTLVVCDLLFSSLLLKYFLKIAHCYHDVLTLDLTFGVLNKRNGKKRVCFFFVWYLKVTFCWLLPHFFLSIDFSHIDSTFCILISLRNSIWVMRFPVWLFFRRLKCNLNSGTSWKFSTCKKSMSYAHLKISNQPVSTLFIRQVIQSTSYLRLSVKNKNLL